MVCKRCEKEFEGLFCPFCGERVEQEMKACPVCGRARAESERFCANCGYAFDKQSEEAPVVATSSGNTEAVDNWTESSEVSTSAAEVKPEAHGSVAQKAKEKIAGLFGKLDDQKKAKLLAVYRWIPTGGVLLFALFTFLSLCSPIMLHYGYAVTGTGLENAFSYKVSSLITTTCVLLFVLFVAELLYFAYRLVSTLSKPYSDVGNKVTYCLDGAMIALSFILSVCAMAGAGKWVASPGAGVTFLIVMDIFAALFLAARIFAERKIAEVVDSDAAAMSTKSKIGENDAKTIKKYIRIVAIVLLCVAIVATTITLPVKMVYFNFTNASTVSSLTYRNDVTERFGVPEGYTGDEGSLSYSAGDRYTYDLIIDALNEQESDFSEEDFEDIFESEDSFEDAFNDSIRFDSYLEQIEDARRYASYATTVFIFDENDRVTEYYCECVNYIGETQAERHLKELTFDATIEKYTDIVNIDYLAKYDDGSFIGAEVKLVADDGEVKFSDRFGEYTIQTDKLTEVSPNLIGGSSYVKDNVLHVVGNAEQILEYDNAGSITEIIIEDEVTSITAGAFGAFTSVNTISGGKDLTYIGADAFSGCSGLTDVYYQGDLSGWLGIEFGNSLANPMYYADNLYINGELLQGEIVIPDGTKKIGAYAFRNYDALTSVTIPDSVTSIGNEAFRECSSLTSVTIGDGVTSIGYRAFDGCSGLTSVTIPDSVTSIGSGAFRGCSGLTSVTIGNGVTSIGDYAFYGCDGLTSVTIPDSVTYIGDYAFSGCSGLTSVAIGDGVTSIGESAFYECSGLTSVTIGSGVTGIGERAFSVCSGLTDVYYQGDLSGWLEIEFGNSLANPMYYADNLYINGELLQGEIVIPDGTKKIGAYAFRNYDALTSVTIPDSVTSIGNEAFRGCIGLTNITIPDSVTSIGDYAFSECSGLTSVTIPDSVTEIGYRAFYGCSDLTTINFRGTVAQWKAIGKGSNWDSTTGEYTVICTDGTISKANA